MTRRDKDEERRARRDLCLPYLQRFLYGSRESGVCSLIRFVLSWTNLFPFPLLDLRSYFYQEYILYSIVGSIE